MSVIIFKSVNNKFSVELNDKILNTIHQECIKSRNKETGGILIGKYSEDSKTIINDITDPPKGSKQGRYIFERAPADLKEILKDIWDLGFRYVGDWHFHPNSSPKPSTVDDKQMKKFATNKKLNCPEPILLIIGGNQDKGWKLSIQIYTKDKKISMIEQPR